MKVLQQLWVQQAILLGWILLAASQAHANPVWTNTAWNGRIEEAVFSADASLMACRMADGSVILKDLAEAEASQSFNSTPFAVTRIALSDDGDTLAWGDTAGMLHIWSADGGLTGMQLSDVGLTGLTLSADGSRVCAASEGVRAYIKRTGNLGTIGNPLLNSEQVVALASDDAGDQLLAIDHKGRLTAFSGNSTSADISDPVSDAPAGLAHVGLDPVKWVLWDVAGEVTLLNASLEVIERIDTGGEVITTVLADAAGHRLLLADSHGKLHQIAFSDYTLKTLSGASGEAPIVGLGGNRNTGFYAVTEFGEWLTSASGDRWEVSHPSLRGNILRAHASLQAGGATVVTDQEARTFSLAHGGARSPVAENGDIILDSAIFHAFGKSAPLRLVFNRDDLSLRLEGESLPDAFPIEEDWSPVRITTSPWTPNLALMSAEGQVRIYEAQPEGLIEISRLDPLPGQLWEDLAFTEDGSSVTRIRAAAPTQAPAPDGPFELRMNPAGSLAFYRLESDPAVLAWPDLRPAGGGGMESGYFGNIQAIRNPWILQREFGWGTFSASQDMNYFRFPGEGWLAGNAQLGSYLYSYNRDNWIYTLIPDFPSDWIYDFAAGQWRRFQLQ